MARRSPSAVHSFWGTGFASTAALPNCATSDVQTDILEAGDVAYVPSTQRLWLCVVATQGAADWIQMVADPPPARVYNYDSTGVMDGQNGAFRLPKFVDGTQSVNMNGMRLNPGVGNDYITAESGGVGTGYDTLVLAVPPSPGSSLLVDYDPI